MIDWTCVHSRHIPARVLKVELFCCSIQANFFLLLSLIASAAKRRPTELTAIKVMTCETRKDRT